MAPTQINGQSVYFTVENDRAIPHDLHGNVVDTQTDPAKRGIALATGLLTPSKTFKSITVDGKPLSFNSGSLADYLLRISNQSVNPLSKSYMLTKNISCMTGADLMKRITDASSKILAQNEAAAAAEEPVMVEEEMAQQAADKALDDLLILGKNERILKLFDLEEKGVVTSSLIDASHIERVLKTPEQQERWSSMQIVPYTAADRLPVEPVLVPLDITRLFPEINLIDYFALLNEKHLLNSYLRKLDSEKAEARLALEAPKPEAPVVAKPSLIANLKPYLMNAPLILTAGFAIGAAASYVGCQMFCDEEGKKQNLERLSFVPSLIANAVSNVASQIIDAIPSFSYGLPF